MLDRMIVCPDCGNKRCPKASNHALKCTNSNDPNQVGSIYTHPPQRTWVGLTDEEMETTFLQCGGKWYGDFWKIEDADFHPFLRTIEAKLKEKNT